MNRCRTLVVLAGALVGASGITTGRCDDKAPSSAVSAPAIALVDVGYLFENYAPFKAKIKEVTAEAQRRQDAVHNEAAERLALAKKIDETPKGSAEYRAMVERLERMVGELRYDPPHEVVESVSIRRLQADIYRETHQLFRQEIADYAKANRITIVIRADRTPIDAKNPDDVLRGVNSWVVWIAPGRDITPIILQRVKDKEHCRSGTGAAPAIAK
jgi:Skp family chaperone for outer membrane proteins